MRQYRALTVMCLFTAANTSEKSMTNEVVCHETSRQNACRFEGVCINDPIRMQKGLDVSFSLKHRTYAFDGMTGQLTHDVSRADSKDRWIVEPPILDGNQIELTKHRQEAKLMGGKFNYYFQCKMAY